MSEHVILIGAYGWRHAAWDGDFYPDDLPDEWQIGYYGNEFPVVMLPNSYWRDEPVMYQEWLEESDDALRFLCEWPDSGATEADYAAAYLGLRELAGRVLGVVVNITAMPSESEWQQYVELQTSSKLCFDVRTDLQAAFLTESQTRLPQQNYGLCWHGQQSDKQKLQHGGLMVCRISQELAPRPLRELLETMLAQAATQRTAVIIVEGDPPAMQLLTNVGIMLDLL